MLSPKQIKSKLENVIDQAHESRRFFVNPDSNFTRKGKCEFKKLISAMLVMEGGTLRDTAVFWNRCEINAHCFRACTGTKEAD